MLLKLLHFAEYAAVTQENKLVIAGIFDGLNISRPPAVAADTLANVPLPAVYLVAILEASVAEGTVHSATLRIIDQDAKPVADPLQLGEWTFVVNPFGRPMRFQAVIHLVGLAVPGPGDYPFELLVDGRSVGDTVLYVTDVTPVP